MSKIEIIEEKLAAEIQAAIPKETEQEPANIASEKPREAITQIIIAQKIAAAMNASPPVISEITERKTLGIEIHIPLGGSAWKKLAAKTGSKTTQEMKEKLAEIAQKEDLDITFGMADDGMGSIVKILKKPGIKYEKPMDRSNRAFISCFESTTVPDPNGHETI